MIKQLLTPLLLFSSLHADVNEKIQPLDPEVVQSLYIESALFVAVFTLMSIISIVISKKHAAQNLLNDKKKREEKAQIERSQKKVEKSSPSVSILKLEETVRVKELSKMLKDGLITDEEFQLLSNTLREKEEV